MCTVIHLNTGHDIETVEDFQKFFELTDIEIEVLTDPDYQNAPPDACLCCLNLDEYMQTKPQFKPETGDYWEEPDWESLRDKGLDDKLDKW